MNDRWIWEFLNIYLGIWIYISLSRLLFLFVTQYCHSYIYGNMGTPQQSPFNSKPSPQRISHFILHLLILGRQSGQSLLFVGIILLPKGIKLYNAISLKYAFDLFIRIFYGLYNLMILIFMMIYWCFFRCCDCIGYIEYLLGYWWYWKILTICYLSNINV